MPRAASKSRKIDEFQLLELISRTPQIYDTNNSRFNDVMLKKQLWEEIAEDMESTTDTVKKLWKKLRADYLKRRKNVEAKRTAKIASLDKALDFLDPAPKERDDSREDNRADSNSSSPKAPTRRQTRSTSRLSAISEANLSITTTSSAATTLRNSKKPMPKSRQRKLPDTETPEQISSCSSSGSVTEPNERYATSLKSSRSLRSCRSESSSTEISTKKTPGTPRRLAITPRKTKMAADNVNANIDFFKRMASTLDKFPSDLQTAVKIQIFDLIADTEKDLLKISVTR